MKDSRDTPLRAPNSSKAIARFAIIVVLVLAGDLLLKWYAFENVAGMPIDRASLQERAELAIPPHQPVAVVRGVISLHLTVNHGAVFGIGQGGRWFFVVIAFVACAIIARVFWLSRANDWLLHASLALITGGALGNLYDRFFFGMVRDMMLLLPETHLPFGWTWPNGSTLVYPWIFNIADAALCVGIGVIVLSMLFGKHGDAKAHRNETKEPNAS